MKKITIKSKFKERATDIKGETYFANEFKIEQKNTGQCYATQVIKTDYMNCKISFPLSQDDVTLLVHLIESSYNNFTEGRIDRDDNTINIFCRRFENTIIFIRFSVLEQPICCFKMTPDQIKDLKTKYKQFKLI